MSTTNKPSRCTRQSEIFTPNLMKIPVACRKHCSPESFFSCCFLFNFRKRLILWVTGKMQWIKLRWNSYDRLHGVHTIGSEHHDHKWGFGIHIFSVSGSIFLCPVGIIMQFKFLREQWCSNRKKMFIDNMKNSLTWFWASFSLMLSQLPTLFLPLLLLQLSSPFPMAGGKQVYITDCR